MATKQTCRSLSPSEPGIRLNHMIRFSTTSTIWELLSYLNNYRDFWGNVTNENNLINSRFIALREFW